MRTRLLLLILLLAIPRHALAGTVESGGGGFGGGGGGDASLAEQNVSTNDVALFALTDTGTAGITGTVNGVRVLVYPRLDSTGTNSFALRVKSGATTETLTGLALTTGGAYLSKVYATDPDTSTAWTLSGVDALELGGIETTAVLSRLMDVQAYVDYTPAASASGGCRMMLCGVGR